MATLERFSECAEMGSREPESCPDDSDESSRPLILLVDDDPIGLRALSSVLRGGGYRLQEAQSGRAGLEAIERDKPDLVLLDVMMPGLDGYEVCSRGRATPGISEIPILLVTALEDRGSRLKGLEAGADDFLSKPLDREEVRARVRTITRLNRFRRLREETLLTRKAAEEIRERAQRQEVLGNIAAALLQKTWPADIASAILPLVRAMSEYDHAAIYHREHRSGWSQLLGEQGTAALALNGLERVNSAELEAILGWTNGAVAVCVDDLIDTDPASALAARLRASGARTLYPVRLSIKEQMLGVMLVVTRESQESWCKTGDFLREVGGVLSLALAHAEVLANLTRGRNQLEQLSQRLIQVREDESRRIARELHDEIGQLLTVLGYSLRGMARSNQTEANAKTLGICIDHVDSLLTSVRSLSLDLHPALLDDLGLVPALRRHLDVHSRATGLKLLLDADEHIERLKPEPEIACYRVAQEAIANAIRHGAITWLCVSLRIQGQQLVLTVADDGCGFDVEQAMQGGADGAALGLIGMRERVSLAGGEVAIDSEPGKGARVVATFPIESCRTG